SASAVFRGRKNPRWPETRPSVSCPDPARIARPEQRRCWPSITEPAMASFQLSGIPHEPYADLFDLSDDDLAKHHAKRMIADADFGFPCRISLRDARIGDELLLLPYRHLSGNSPYRAAGPVFVSRHAVRQILPPGD